MILTTSDAVEGRKIKRSIGLVRGNTVRARFFVRDIIAGFKLMLGGEVHEYTALMAQSRDQAVDRMIEDAKAKGANAVVGIRFVTASVMQGAAEILVYGTAVELE